MKLVSYRNSEHKERLGIVVEDRIADLHDNGRRFSMILPTDMKTFLNEGIDTMENAKTLENKLQRFDFETVIADNLLAPVPHPTSCRDGYAFRQHVASARRNRGLDMIPEFDEYPIFYFTNHNAVFGEGEVIVEDDHLFGLDFELEWACVIGKRGKNISSNHADSYIVGYTIMNDLSARTLQMEEMKLNLGPAKGKDFATTIGPWLVTPDELEQYKSNTQFGNQYDLEMKAFHNGKQISYGNTNSMTWTFAEIIERASYGVDLFPGDVIGSGTVGTGCYLELNGTWALEAKAKGETHTSIWLKDGDTIELEVTGLGKLKNTIKKNSNINSILNKKKKVGEE